jgi:hypothetical protein
MWITDTYLNNFGDIELIILVKLFKLPKEIAKKVRFIFNFILISILIIGLIFGIVKLL